MTFTLTEECLFCGKQRIMDKGEEWESENWKTLLSVFEVRSDKEPRVGGGVVVTVCRECRKVYTAEQLIAKAREVW